MATTYTFSISLLDANADAGQNQDEVRVWQSGTLTVDSDMRGALTLPDYYKEPIPFTGSTVPPQSQAGTILAGSGQSSEAQITFTIVHNYDGFLYPGSYLGGLVSLLDYSAQETYLYVIQGLSTQG